ncbi:MAG: pyruvate/oxaloacetate carboxyltransferase [Cryomorphaceae bacterium]|jgi:pyruvate/oxaloacetate carboxyltransferase
MPTSETSKSPKFVNLTLRDGQQSTLAQEDWVFDPSDLSKVIAASHKAGFSGAEISGGQSFQIAINCGYNPFTILNAVSHAMEYGGFRDDFQLQMLFRGANALGFRHYDKDLIEKTLQEFIKCGINKIRFFDALNDIDNLRLPASIKSQQDIILEGALCFTHYSDHPHRYTDDYYLNYAETLIAEGYTAIAIKDMSGQLTAQRVSTLVPALLEKLTSNNRNIPLTLHIHSTHHENSLGAMQQALQYGVDTIETTEGVLSGGSAHHSLASISSDIIPDSEAYEDLQTSIAKIWSSQNTTPDRKDQHIPDDLKQQLCAAGVPGGAMPFVIRDLSQQQSTIRAKYQASKHTPEGSDLEKFEAIIDLFILELKQVCSDANLPLLVTPTADICCKQAIANLAFGSDPYSGNLAGRYLNNSGQPNPDARFAKLILGHYGELKSYTINISDYSPESEIITFFEAHNAAQLKTITTTAADSTTGDDLRESQQQAWKLIQKLGAGALSFASFDQLTILYALKPYAPQASIDPIHNAVQAYLDRSEKSKIDGRGSIFPGYEFLMQPLLCYMRSMFVFNKQLDAQDIVKLPLSSFGTHLCNDLYDIYIDLCIWKNLTNLSNHLSLLFSSSHISPQLIQAAQYVSDTLAQLDLRPEKNDSHSIDQGRQKFTTLTIAELFSSLALINSFVNDVAKHATNPSLYAERSLTLQDIRHLLTQQAKQETQTPWQERVRQSLVGKRLRLESDLEKRLETWRK